MPKSDSQRALVKIVREVCARRNIRLESFSGDWMFSLHAGDKSARIFGYDFDLNPAAAKMIAKDKAATSDLLQAFGIPHVEHRLFHGPQLAEFVPAGGNWSPMLDYFRRCGHDLVCKPNEGTGGRGVYRARTPAALENSVQKLFAASRSICLSPYEPFESEYRVGVLDGQVEFLYRKERPHFIGDGRANVRELVLAHFQNQGNLFLPPEIAADFAKSETDDSRVPADGEMVILNWRHNLGQGARPSLIDPQSRQGAKIGALATQALKALGIRVASADIVEINGTLKVLEINSGIMMENFVNLVPAGWELATRFYDKIICAMLQLDYHA